MSVDHRKLPRGTPLAPRILARLRAFVEDTGSVEAASRRLDIPLGKMFRALKGERLYPASHEEFAAALKETTK